MNRKGFTLIELLATIVILAIVSGIATVGVVSIINKSKSKSEQVFVAKVSNLIDDYLDLYPPTTPIGEIISFEKCKFASCSTDDSNAYTATATKIQKQDGSTIYLKDLVDANVIDQDKLVNPKNKKHCLLNNENGPEIIVYKDSDYVYYYYVDLTGTNTTCDISLENGIINTLPDNLKSKVGLS